MPWNTLFEHINRPEQETLTNAYRRVFNTPEGRMVLADLCTSLKLVQNVSKGGVDMADARAFADGQRSVALRILNHMEEKAHD